jgi:hypothetical protein
MVHLRGYKDIPSEFIITAYADFQKVLDGAAVLFFLDTQSHSIYVSNFILLITWISAHPGAPQ